MKKLLIIAVLSFFHMGFAQAQHHHNNLSFSLFGPGFGISSNHGHGGFYFGFPIQQQMMFVRPIPLITQFQPMNLNACGGNVYMDVDQFGNQISPQYRICWNVDQFGNQISPQYRQY